MGEAADKSKVRFQDFVPGEGKPEAPKVTILRQPRRAMRFVSLHHHSTFSYQDGFQLPAAHARRATEIGMQAFALTEHGNVSSHTQLEIAAIKEGVKPIFGCEIYMGPVGEKHTQRKYHLTVLAATAEGYRNLLRMVSHSFRDFYYEPTVSWETLKRYNDGLIVLSGCTGSLLACSLVGGKLIAPDDSSYERGLRVAKIFHTTFGDRYYLEAQSFPELENVVRLNNMLEELSAELQIPLVATGDVHYTLPNENEMQEILHNIRAGNKQTLEEQSRAWSYNVSLAPPLNDRAMLRRMESAGLSPKAAKEAVLNTEVIASRCNVELPKLPQLRFPIPSGFSSVQEVWEAWLREGWKYRKCDKLPPLERARYKRQLQYEMSIIEQKDFTDYFLIVSDMVKFAKDADIAVGPARGSAAASIICWLLRITEVNPMIFPGLVFERFIDLTRVDLPDIDLDFDSTRRHEITDYAVAKYGRECVGQIGTFTYFKSKNSLDDIGHVYRIPKYAIETVKELLIERSSGDLRASATIEDTIEQFEAAAAVVERYPDIMKATALEGNIKGMGVHASGLVLANGPITDVCALYEREVKGELVQVISLDKYDAERQGLIKVDILGLNTMTMISRALRMLGLRVSDLYEIPLDDPAVIKGFHDNDVVAIFQFDGRAMRSVNAELQPDNFKEICDVNALARPGPLHNNASAAYIDIKKGRKEPERLHPVYDEIASQTNYQIVYQEQILRIVREIGGFDWTAASYIRKIISKKLGEQEFSRQWSRFWEGAQTLGIDEETAKKIWGLCITSGSYAFNAAHCCAYGMLAYWCMWLKIHHPVEFYVASLSTYDPKKHQLNLLRDALKHGIVAEPPDVNLSGASWTAAEGRLLGGFGQVPTIGEKTGQLIVDWREDATSEKPQATWDDLLAIKGIGAKTVEKFHEFATQEDPFEIQKLHRILEGVKKDIRRWNLPRPTHTSLEVPYSRGRDTQVTWVGMLRHRNLRDLFESNFARTGEALDPKEVKDPELREWVIGVGYDEDELVTITWDRWKYPRFKKAIWEIRLDHDVILVRGVKKGFQARRAIYVTDLWVIDPDEESTETEELEGAI